MKKNIKENLTDATQMYSHILQRVWDGESFSVNFEKRTLRLGRKPVDLSNINFPFLTDEKVIKGIERAYHDYKYSIPSERSEARRKRYFKALPEAELTDDEMISGLPREYAQCDLELYILFNIIAGNLRWHKSWGSWFWQSPNDKDLVILRQWIEPAQKGGVANE